THRRRYTETCAKGNSGTRPHCPDESRHAAHRNPAAPHEMDAVVREPALHRTRRIAHLAWGVRESSRECTQATEAYCEVLWLRSAIHLLFSHDCEPRRAGFSAYRERSRSCRRERGTGGREAFRVLQPANGEPKS